MNTLASLHRYFCFKVKYFQSFTIYIELFSPFATRVRIGPQYSLIATEWAGASDETKQKRGPVPQQVWHDKNPSLPKDQNKA